MFKRANKITSLLVAAAAVVSIVPASAADRIGTIDGVVYNAQAYNGTFVIDGQPDGKDDEGYYFLQNGEIGDLDIEDGDYTTYGEKYLDVDGNYYVDLETGDVTEDLADDNLDDAEDALRSAVKKADRYDDDDQTPTLTQVPGNKYGEVWYQAVNEYAVEDLTETVVYTDADGNYIDGTFNLGEFDVEVSGNATTGTTTDVVTLEDEDEVKTDATTKDAAGVNNVKVKVNATVDNIVVIAQDDDYIYRKAKLTVTSENGTVVKVNGRAYTDAVDVIQKVSKAQSSEDAEDAKYSKEVKTYFVVAEDGTTEYVEYENHTVVDGKLVGYEINTVDGFDVLTAQAFELKSRGNTIEQVDDAVSTDDDVNVYTTELDADGNIWALTDEGKIIQFNNDDDFDEVYKVDSSMDEFSVYDKDNMVAWNEDEEIYSIIGTDAAVETPVEETPVVTTGWAQATDGTWTFVKADGTKATGWLLDGATWYYLKADGVMATGWVNDGGTWYYLAGSGAMATGWLNDNGTWYYLAGSGAMLANTTVDGYVLGASGAWVK